MISQQLTKFLTENENAYESQRKIKQEIKEEEGEMEEKENKPTYGMFRSIKREPEATLTQPSKESVDKVSILLYRL